MHPHRQTDFAYLDRFAFADASLNARFRLVRDWIQRGRLQHDDASFVRQLRERDLGEAREIFGPFLAMVSILGAIFIAALNWISGEGQWDNSGMLIASGIAGVGIVVGLTGSWLGLHWMVRINRELAAIDARTMR